MRIALLTCSTRPRGGVVHTFAPAEEPAAAGQDVTVWTLGRGGDGRFFRDAPAYDVVHAQDCISANAVLEHAPGCLRTVHHLDTFTTPELAACHERAIVEPARHVCVSAAVAAELAAGWGIAVLREVFGGAAAHRAVPGGNRGGRPPVGRGAGTEHRRR